MLLQNYNLSGNKLQLLNDYNMTALYLITVCMLVPQVRNLVVILKSTEVIYLIVVVLSKSPRPQLSHI